MLKGTHGKVVHSRFVHTIVTKTAFTLYLIEKEHNRYIKIRANVVSHVILPEGVSVFV